MLANTVDPNQMPHYVASDLGLHRLPMTFLGVSRLEWVRVRVKILNLIESVSEGFPSYPYLSYNVLVITAVIVSVRVKYNTQMAFMACRRWSS